MSDESQEQLSIVETFDALRKAGGDAWDHIEDPRLYLARNGCPAEGLNRRLLRALHDIDGYSRALKLLLENGGNEAEARLAERIRGLSEACVEAILSDLEVQC